MKPLGSQISEDGTCALLVLSLGELRGETLQSWDSDFGGGGPSTSNGHDEAVLEVSKVGG